MEFLSDYVRHANAAVEAIAIGGNPIGSKGGATLLETIKTSKLKTIDIGKPLPLQEPYGSDTLDLSKTKMDPGHVLLLSWWLTTRTEFSAAVARLILNDNPLTGGRRDSDFDTDRRRGNEGCQRFATNPHPTCSRSQNQA